MQLFKKTQKLLDRLLFIFFAEDCGLLPPNMIMQIVERWEILRENDDEHPLYDIFKKHFNYLNEGYKGKKYDMIVTMTRSTFKTMREPATVEVTDALLAAGTLRFKVKV